MEKLTRRDFLVKTGVVAAGTAAGLALASCGTAPSASSDEQKHADAPPLPWTYAELDPEAAAARGYDGYYEGACCYGAFSAIIDGLKEKVGEPFNTIPTKMMKYGEGGIVGWSTICGALNGASAAINLVCDEETYGKVINELMGWYTEFAFPAYVPPSPRTDVELVTSVSGSPLCHVSVTNWCKESGFGAKSKERSERCSRLTADVARKAVELLNAAHAGKFAAAYETPQSVTGCMSCHGADAMNNTRGKMDCVQCHEPHN